MIKSFISKVVLIYYICNWINWSQEEDSHCWTPEEMLPQIDEQLEIINDIPIAMLDEVEREMYKQKLMIEITHFKERE